MFGCILITYTSTADGLVYLVHATIRLACVMTSLNESAPHFHQPEMKTLTYE